MQNKIQGRENQRSIIKTKLIRKETAETESTAHTTCRCEERIYFGTYIFMILHEIRMSRYHSTTLNLCIPKVVSRSMDLSRRAVDAMGQECKNGVKFISVSEATKYRFGRPVQVLIEENQRITSTFEMCLKNWQEFGCNVWYFAESSSSTSSSSSDKQCGTKLHMRGLVFRKKEDDDHESDGSTSSYPSRSVK